MFPPDRKLHLKTMTRPGITPGLRIRPDFTKRNLSQNSDQILQKFTSLKFRSMCIFRSDIKFGHFSNSAGSQLFDVLNYDLQQKTVFILKPCFSNHGVGHLVKMYIHLVTQLVTLLIVCRSFCRTFGRSSRKKIIW